MAREGCLLNTSMFNGRNQVWRQATGDLLWLAQQLQPARLRWNFLGLSPQHEAKRFLQELTLAVEGSLVNLKKLLIREISLPVAEQI